MAFGTQPGDFGDAGIPTPPPPEDQFGQLVDDIHRIKQKYVDGATNYRQPLNLAANAVFQPSQQLDFTGQKVNSIVLTAITGVIFAYLFPVDSQSGAPASVPDLVADASIARATVQIMIPEREDYKIGVQEGAGAAATGVIRVMKL